MPDLISTLLGEIPGGFLFFSQLTFDTIFFYANILTARGKYIARKLRSTLSFLYYKMKKDIRIVRITFLSLAFLSCAIFSFSQEPPGSSAHLSLKDCYRLALKQSEKVAISAQAVKEAEGSFLQSLSGILPQASFVYTEKRQDGSNNSSSTLSRVPEAKFVFSQSLFSGFKEFAAIAASRAQKKQYTQLTIRAGHLLFTDVVDAFYLFLTYQEDINILLSIHSTLAERVDELARREKLGRARASELAITEAELARVQADLELLYTDAEVSQQLLEFLTGTKIESVDDLEIPSQNEIILTTDEEYLLKAQKRPDVEADYQAWQIAKQEVRIARAGYWPAVSLDGNSYTKRVGAAGDVDWDATLKVDVPLFDGTQTMGEVKEAAAQEKAAELKFQQTTRNAVLEIKNAGTKYQRSFKRKEALFKALQATEKSYNLQLEDSKRSLISNLDLLKSLEDLEQMRRDYLQAQYETKRFYWNLKVASADIGEILE